MLPIDLLGMIRKALKVSDSVLTFRLAILTFQGTKVRFKGKNRSSLTTKNDLEIGGSQILFRESVHI